MGKKLNSVLGVVCATFLSACATTAEKEIGIDDISPDNHRDNVTLQENSVDSDSKKDECYDSGNGLELPIPYVNIPLDNECKPDTLIK